MSKKKLEIKMQKVTIPAYMLEPILADANPVDISRLISGTVAGRFKAALDRMMLPVAVGDGVKLRATLEISKYDGDRLRMVYTPETLNEALDYRRTES